MAEVPDPRMIRFLRRHHVMTLATASPGEELWCCNLFYALSGSGELPQLVFTSAGHTRHSTQMTECPAVAGSVVLESRTVGKLQGLQFRGKVQRADNDPNLLKEARKVYLKRFPYALPALKNEELWMLTLTQMKYTDNTLGFGTKLHWPERS